MERLVTLCLVTMMVQLQLMSTLSRRPDRVPVPSYQKKPNPRPGSGGGGGGGPGSGTRDVDCALFKSNDTVALSSGESTYIDIGEVDVTDSFTMSMEVMPSPLNHNGILLSVGSTPNFEYYEWKTKAVSTQFLVVEFIFSALALTVKALHMEHLQQIEVYKTWPKPYHIDDAKWHQIKVHRDKDNWHLFIDRLNVTRPISNRTNVQLLGMHGFIGGRPGYTDHQFQGVIKNVRINGRNVQLGGRRPMHMHGRVDVWLCDKDETEFFINWIKQSKQHG